MNVNPNPLMPVLGYQLGQLGKFAGYQFAKKIEPYGLKLKHVDLLAALQAQGSATQQELATQLQVAPSLVVILSDDLEAIHAIQRVRDAKDRRRQNLTLQPHGEKLLAICIDIAHDIDNTLTANLNHSQTQTLRELLMAVAPNKSLDPSENTVIEC